MRVPRTSRGSSPKSTLDAPVKTVDRARNARRWLLVLGGISLLSGLNAGLVRLGVWAPVASDRMGDLHGPVMVMGFLGTVISLERAQALRHPLALLAPGLLGGGAIVLMAGGPVVLGKLFLVEGALVFVLVMLALWRRTRADLVAAQTLGALLLAVGAATWMITDVASLIPLLAAFLIVTIAGERAELAQLSMGPRAITVLPWLTVVLGLSAVASLLWPDPGHRLLGAACIVTAVWLFRDDVGRRLIRTTGFRRFNAAALLGGNLWLAVAGATWLVAGTPQRTGTYDIAVHGVFLGFAFSMIMAHAPTIFPAVLGRPLPYRPVMWVPLVLLHLGMIYRASGDLLAVDQLRVVGAVVTVVAVLAFLATGASSTLRSAPAEPLQPQQPSRPTPTVEAERMTTLEQP